MSRLAILVCLRLLCPDSTLGFETNHPHFGFHRERRSTRTASTTAANPGFSFGHSIKRLNCNNNIAWPSPRNNGVTTLSSPLSASSASASHASNSNAPLEAAAPTSSSWEEVVSPLPPSQHLSTQGTTAATTLTPHSSDSVRRHTAVTAHDKALIGSFVGLAAATVVMFLLYSAPGAWRFFLAGGICAATSHAIPTPVDVVKVGTRVVF
jgi:hypothetical protein